MYIISFTRNTSRNTIKTRRCHKRHRTYTWPKSIAMHQTKMESIELPYARSSVDINMDSYFRPKYRIHFKIVMLRAGFSMFQHNMDARRVLLLWPPCWATPRSPSQQASQRIGFAKKHHGKPCFCLARSSRGFPAVLVPSTSFNHFQDPSNLQRDRKSKFLPKFSGKLNMSFFSRLSKRHPAETQKSAAAGPMDPGSCGTWQSSGVS